MKLNVFRFALCLFSLGGVMLGANSLFASHARAASNISHATSLSGQIHARALPDPQGDTTQIVTGDLGSRATSNTKGTATVACPAGWTLTGGGFIVPDFNNGTGTIADVNESRASSTTTDGVTTWTWTVTYRNTGGGSIAARAQAICQQPAPEKQPSTQRVNQTLNVTAGQRSSTFVSCPAGSVVTGGGAHMLDGGVRYRIMNMYPYSSTQFFVDVLGEASGKIEAVAQCLSLQ